MLARAGRFEEAHALLEEARGEYERAGDDGEMLVTDARLAECLVLEGEGEAARDLATAALRRAEALGDVFGSKAVLYRARGWAHLQLGLLEEAREDLEVSLEDARERAAEYDIALALDALAVLRRVVGEACGSIEKERDAIFKRLKLVETPAVPLPEAEPAAPRGTASSP